MGIILSFLLGGFLGSVLMAIMVSARDDEDWKQLSVLMPA